MKKFIVKLKSDNSVIGTFDTKVEASEFVTEAIDDNQIDTVFDVVCEEREKFPATLNADLAAELMVSPTSLQQEQPKKSAKNCKDCPHCVDLKAQDGWHFKGCFGGSYKGKWIAEIDECPLKQKQTEVDLEKEIERIIKNEDRFMKFQVKEQLIKYVARHFAEWGATHLDKKEKTK